MVGLVVTGSRGRAGIQGSDTRLAQKASLVPWVLWTLWAAKQSSSTCSLFLCVCARGFFFFNAKTGSITLKDLNVCKQFFKPH